MARKPTSNTKKSVDAITHKDAKRKNIPTAELGPVMQEAAKDPVPVTYKRNRDLDPQLMWRGKDEQRGPQRR